MVWHLPKVRTLTFGLSYKRNWRAFMNKTIVELFAGVGGFRLGFELNGHTTVTLSISVNLRILMVKSQRELTYRKLINLPYQVIHF